MFLLDGFSGTEINHLYSAFKVAKKSKCRQQVGALVVKGGSVIAAAYNVNQNSPTILEEEKVRSHASLCAERRALRMVDPEKCAGAVVYVARVQKSTGGFGVSKPCDRCQKVMKELGIKRAIYVD